MLRNEELYPEPDRFRPERYFELADEATIKRRDPRNHIFGFGRRYVISSAIPSTLCLVLSGLLDDAQGCIFLRRHYG